MNYNLIKGTFGPWTKVTDLVSLSNGTFLKEKSVTLYRWAEYFQELLNQINSLDATSFEEGQELYIGTEFEDSPTLDK